MSFWTKKYNISLFSHSVLDLTCIDVYKHADGSYMYPPFASKFFIMSHKLFIMSNKSTYYVTPFRILSQNQVHVTVLSYSSFHDTLSTHKQSPCSKFIFLLICCQVHIKVTQKLSDEFGCSLLVPFLQQVETGRNENAFSKFAHYVCLFLFMYWSHYFRNLLWI